MRSNHASSLIYFFYVFFPCHSGGFLQQRHFSWLDPGANPCGEGRISSHLAEGDPTAEALKAPVLLDDRKGYKLFSNICSCCIFLWVARHDRVGTPRSSFGIKDGLLQTHLLDWLGLWMPSLSQSVPTCVASCSTAVLGDANRSCNSSKSLARRTKKHAPALLGYVRSRIDGCLDASKN